MLNRQYPQRTDNGVYIIEELLHPTRKFYIQIGTRIEVCSDEVDSNLLVLILDHS